MKCEQGHEVEAGQKFCPECGSPVKPEPAQAAERSGKRIGPLGVGAVIAVLIAAGVGIFLLGKSSTGGGSGGDGQVLQGVVAVGGYIPESEIRRAEITGDDSMVPSDGATCTTTTATFYTATGGFEHISEGALVSVDDGSGTTVGAASLEAGEVRNFEPTGRYDFEFSTPIEGPSVFAITVGGAQPYSYTRDRLEELSWEAPICFNNASLCTD